MLPRGTALLPSNVLPLKYTIMFCTYKTIFYHVLHVPRLDWAASQDSHHVVLPSASLSPTRTTFSAADVQAEFRGFKLLGCSLGLERLGLEPVSRRVLERLVSVLKVERLGLVSVSRVWKNRTSRSRLGLEG